MQNRVERVVLLSGMDSLIAYHFLNRPDCIYVKLGHRYQEKEVKSLVQLKSVHWRTQLRFIDFPLLGQFEPENAIIPTRNSFLAHIGSLFADDIVLVAQKGETTTVDKTPEFYQEVSSLLTRLHQHPIRVWSPFMNVTKGQMVIWFKNNCPDYIDDLFTIAGCYSKEEGVNGYCNACSSCFRKWAALEFAGIDTSKYFPTIFKWDGTREYIEKFKAGVYDPQREKETMVVLKKFGVVK